MCDPLTIAGIALTAGSTVANTVAANQAASARSAALAAERARQTGLDRQSDALNATSRERYSGFEENQDAKAQEIGSYLAAQTAPEQAPAEAMPTAATSNITVQEENKQRASAKSDTDASATALGDLRSFGDLLGSISRSQARDAGQIGQIGGFKQGYANVLPYDLEAAAQKGAGLRTLGDILGGIGSLATGAGLSGKSFSTLFTGMRPMNATGAAASVTRAGATLTPPRVGPTRFGGLY